MVTVVGVEERDSDGGKFNVIVLQDKMEIVRSNNTGLPYLRARKAAIPFTFSVEYARSLIGTELPGEIEKYECEEYEFPVPGTRKKLKLTHKYRYHPAPVDSEGGE